MGKTLIFLSAEHFHVHTWKNGALSGARSFADSHEGREQFATFLQAHRGPAYLLTDLIEEDFRHEIVPHLRGSERTELIQRKFEQFYRNSPFRQALLLRRLKEGRRDDDILFSALTNPPLILPWLGIMQEQFTPVAGVYSVPNISAPLVKSIPSDHLLLLSWEKHAGLRETYFDAKLLRFSRLTPIGADRSFSETVATEAARTQQYLKSLSLIPAGNVLDVYIICHASDRRDLAEHLGDSADIRYTYLDIQELGQRIKSKTAYEDSDATPLFLHLLATHPPPSHYAAPAITRLFRLLQVRRSLFWLSGMLTAASLLWSAANAWEGRWLAGDSEFLRAQAAKLSQQAQQVAQGSSNTPTSASDMKAAVLLVRELGSYSPPPQNILTNLSRALDDFPRIHIDKLSWQMYAGQIRATPDNTMPATPQPNGGTAGAPAHVILLDGKLTGFTVGDYRNMLGYMERFQQALAQRGYGVTVLSLPLDISPKGSIAASVGEGNVLPTHFSLKLSQGVAP